MTTQKKIQKATEKQLMEQAAILDNSLVGIVIAQDRKIIWANATAEALAGYQKGELMGCPTEQLYAKEEDYQAIGMAYAKIKETDIIKNEIELLRKDGQSVWVDVRGTVLNEEQDKTLWIFIDVTERKRSKFALSQEREKYRILFEVSNEAIVVFDDTGFIDANTAALGLFGCSLSELLGKSLADVSPKTQLNGQCSYLLAQQHIATAIKQGKHQFEWQHKRMDTHQPFSADVLISATMVSGKPVIQATVRNITQQKQHEFYQNMRHQVMSLLLKEASLKTLLETIVHIIESAYSGIICSVLLLNQDKTQLLMMAASSQLPDFYKKAIDGMKVDESSASYGATVLTKQRIVIADIQTHPHWKAHKKVADKAGLSACWLQPIIGLNNRVLGVFSIYREEISSPEPEEIELIEFVAQLMAVAIGKNETNEKMKLLENIFIHTHEGITITDKNKRIVDINPAFTEITGYSREEVIGKDPSLLSSGKQNSAFYEQMWQQINQQGYWQGEVWNRHKKGNIYVEFLNISTVQDENNEIVHYIGVFSDITRSKQQQEKISLMAHYDVLTRLPNRTLFVDRFHQSIAHSHRTDQQLAVCFLDLDNFKPINDTHGHKVGDQLLIEVAQRITAAIREEDTVSRQGGDEFTLLLNDIASIEQCEQMIARIHYDLAQPYRIDGHFYKISASTGVTLYPNDNSDIDTLLRHADHAMYQAKQAGGGCYHLFNTEQNHAITIKQQQLNEIEQALIKNEFRLFYQPKVNMQTGEIFGAEALIRWIHPEKGLIPPLDFLPVVDGTALEIKIGDWVINQALEQLNSWQQQGITLEISVNIASYHLLSVSFAEKLELALSQYPAVNSKNLQLEVLETSALGDLDSIIEIIKRCKNQLGISFALDDFGTGYSSLNHLRNLPINTIKVDQSFVRDMLDDADDYVIVDGVIRLAGSFGRGIIAEGVETTPHGLMLLLIGCEQAQGYGISKPIPAEKFPNWLQHTYVPNQAWLSFGRKQRSNKEKRVELYCLASQQWQRRFIDKVQAPFEALSAWPIMDRQCCPCGYWLYRAKQEQLFQEPYLDKLEQAHEEVHRIAHKVRAQYQEGHLEQARDGLAEVKRAFDKMRHVLSLCK